jgi:peroxiredoxin
VTVIGKHSDGARTAVGDVVAGRELRTITGESAHVPDPHRLVHLQFRRFAGCPFCNLHLRSLAQRHAEIEAAGIHEVAVFHSSASSLLEHEADLPFAIVADPDKHLYAEFGVESSVRAELDPRAWLPALRGAARMRKLPDFHGGIVGLPADFLIASDGRVLAFKYGVHAYDQWSVDELLALAA